METDPVSSLADPALAQVPSKHAMTIADVEAAIRRLGAVFTPTVLQTTRELYRPLVETCFWAHRQVIAELPYGPHERHRLDIFPTDRPRAPVVLFVHGGGFVGGHKSADPVFYANVGRYFASKGYVCIAMNYRLAGAAAWPAGRDDVQAALDWMLANIVDYGGDPSRIVALGQSAGAAHVAAQIFNPAPSETPAGRFAGAVLMSGHYVAKPPFEPGVTAYYGEDDRLWAERSPLTHVEAGHPPILLSVAEFDPANIAAQTLNLAATMNLKDGRPPRLAWIKGCNHVSTVHGLGVGEDRVGRTLLAFFKDLFAPQRE